MQIRLEITDHEKYPEDVDISGLKFYKSKGFVGDVVIGDKCYTGEHGSFDYLEHGFQIVAVEHEEVI